MSSGDTNIHSGAEHEVEQNVAALADHIIGGRVDLLDIATLARFMDSGKRLTGRETSVRAEEAVGNLVRIGTMRVLNAIAAKEAQP